MDKSKQKKFRSLERHHSQNQLNKQLQFKQFNKIYPHPPSLLTTPKTIPIHLHYKHQTIKFKISPNTPAAHIPYIFHRQIYCYLAHNGYDNPLRRTAQIVGFQSTNLLLDYQISIGSGGIDCKMSLKCLEYVSDGKLKKYRIYKCLAIGGFSKVYLVRSLRDGKFYAMKVMMKKFISQNQKESIIQNERDIGCQLNHPFIVKLNHCFETHHFVCLVLDYCPGGQLFYYLKQVKRMSEDDARFYFIEILYGLMYLHQNNIIYRDLKPQNLLIAHDGHIKIADFGLSKSKMNGREVTYSFCGSTQYMPPEMILRQGHSFGVDFYTLGALLYELVTGLPPFYSRDQEEIKMAIVNQQLTFPSHVQLSIQIKSLLNSLLQKNPKHRLGSMKGLKQVLFHPWIGRINAEQVLSKKLTPPHIPSVEEFNFDENQLGNDEVQFTQLILNQHLISGNKQKLSFNNFEFLNEHPITPQIAAIYQKQRDRPLKYSKSSKNIKSVSKEKLKRQSSSPYLSRRPFSQINNIKTDISIKKRNSYDKLSNCKTQNKFCSSYLGCNKSIIARKSKQNKNPFLKKQAAYNIIRD